LPRYTRVPKFSNYIKSTPRFYSLYLKAPTHAKRCFYDLKGPFTIHRQTFHHSNMGCVTLWPCHLHEKVCILRQKKKYGNSNISPCKSIIFKRSSKRNQNPSRFYYNSITNLKFQHKPKYHLSNMLI
jgi:hypothetical protein